VTAIDNLIAQIEDIALRERLRKEIDRMKKEKQFGLVFEEHLPEATPVYSALVQKGCLVIQRGNPLMDLWLVLSVVDGHAHCLKRASGERREIAIRDLVVVRQFGEPIFPALKPVDSIQNGPDDSSWHTLIEADNYHALQLLEYLYSGQVDCIYIDPPFNTGARDWKYNNDYVDSSDSWRHSKWLAMMGRRLRLAKRLLRHDGALICAIDDNELSHLWMLINSIFPNRSVFPVTIQHNPGGTQGDQFSVNHEYALFVIKDDVELYPKKHLGGDTYNLRRWGSTSTRSEGKNCFYPIYVKDNEIIEFGEISPDDFHPSGQVVQKENGIYEVWPIDKSGIERKWRYARGTVESVLERTFVITSNDRIEILLRRKSEQLKTVWVDNRYNAETYGTKLLTEIIEEDFPFPKSLYNVYDCLSATTAGKKDALILDFFAGSGTTLHAVNLLNSTDDGNRRCILVTNNEVSEDEAKVLLRNGHSPGDPEWEEHGICKAIAWPRSRNTILGKREDGSELKGEYFSGKMVDKSMQRKFKHIGFTSFQDLKTVTQIKQLVALIEGIPQSDVKKDTAFVVSKKYPASILFDESQADAWIESLEGQVHITNFYIVTPIRAVFDSLKTRVSDLLGPVIITEEDRRPMSEGFIANLEYLKLDFLDKDHVALGQQFREILPLLWLRAGAIGPRTELPKNEVIPPIMLPKKNPFAVLVDENRFGDFLSALEDKKEITHVFLVTDSEEAFQEMAAQLSVPNVVQLYRDYLENFVINRGV